MFEPDEIKKKAPKDHNKLLYAVDEVPPHGVLLSVAFQQILSSLSSALFTGYIIADVVCAAPDHPIRAKIFCTTLFMCGFCTSLQSLIGIRLPIFQGPSSTFLIPLLALRNTDAAWNCSSQTISQQLAENTYNHSLTEVDEISDDIIYGRLRQLSGSLIAASVLEVVVGLTGVVGLVIRLIGPLSVSATILLIAFALIKIPIIYSKTNWPVALVTAILITVFTLYMDRVLVPLITGWKRGKFTITKLPLFKVLPILLAMLVGWGICGVLTATGSLPDDPALAGYRARTDAKDRIVRLTPWFHLIYPGQFGTPGFSTAVFLGFVAAIISSIVESVGDYFAAAGICQVPPPPRHAINRGILVEGVGSVVSGLYGAGHATTSYSTNIAVVGLTQVASRSAWVATGIIAMILSFIGKLGAVLSTLPEPVIGGKIIVGLGMMVSIAITTLKDVDIQSSRNMAILGISVYTGLVIPQFLEMHPDAIDTGNIHGNQIIKVVIGTPMFLGVLICVILDNTVKGTLKERGLENWGVKEKKSKEVIEDDTAPIKYRSIYDFPHLRKFIRKSPFLQKLPFLPPGEAEEP
ncbi:hypothetical protein ScPMuIL_000265 [Solemya velum]